MPRKKFCGEPAGCWMGEKSNVDKFNIAGALQHKQIKDGKFATENFALSLSRELKELEYWLNYVRPHDPPPPNAQLEAVKTLVSPLLEYLRGSLR